MRKLIYVPIIHVSVDLGDIGAEVSERGKNIVGERAWNKHRQTILGFWDSIASFFESLEQKNLKIYQDGLMIDGDVGLKIISNGAKRGSKNFEIVSKLISQGAQIVSTEDFALIKREYDYLIKITKAKTKIKKILAALNYKVHKKNLLKKRDKFIARSIDKTLGTGEAGVLFLGADHQIISRLPEDIEVIELKKREKIKEYQKRFLSKKDKEKLDQLAAYLSSAIEKKS